MGALVGRAGRRSQAAVRENHTTLTRQVYGQVFTAGRPNRVGPYDGPSWGVFYEPRVTRGDVVALRLSRRNAASESEAACDLRTAKPLSQLR